VLGLAVPVDSLLFNAAAVVHRGAVIGCVPKEKLPTYNVFYEGRTFSRGGPALALDAAGWPLGDYLFRFDFGTVGVEVCEDAWAPDGPMRRRCLSGAELVVNVSASPYRMGIVATRREMLATRAADNQTVLLYANAVGAQDGLVYDGGGYVFQNGRLVLEAQRFAVGTAAAVVDLDRTRRLRMENSTWRADCEHYVRREPPVTVLRADGATSDTRGLAYPAPAGGSFFLPPPSPPGVDARDEALDDLFEALAMGVASYYEKTGAFSSLGLALSGGRDSMLTLLVAWRAAARILGPDASADAGAPGRLITAFYMPTRHSQDATRTAAHELAAALGVTLHTVPLDDAYDREVEAAAAMLGGRPPGPMTRQNVQARLRGQRMWNWANTSGALFLQTGDMSEKAVGYTTIGGDLEGALSVIANVPKTVVEALLVRLHARFGFDGITATLATAPGPELADRQEAEQELMPFPILDACLHLYAGEKLSPPEMAEALVSVCPGYDREYLAACAARFTRLFTQSIYKWVQSPLALHVGSLDLDRERALQMPVVQRTEW
ncbi:MAG: NAD(+) synthase, partial [Vicinamibacterales bacterium]